MLNGFDQPSEVIASILMEYVESFSSGVEIVENRVNSLLDRPVEPAKNRDFNAYGICCHDILPFGNLGDDMRLGT